LVLETFLNWETHGSAVQLENKTFLTPKTPEKSGLMYNFNPIESENWKVDIDIELNKAKQASTGKLYLYFLRDNPQTTSTDFTNGLHGAFNGLEI
jgi:hypothetical protein